ncbi:hypothetical protein LZ32DRAFT_238628 [Colletotrichum eremochloae]|nr:hypothetical protein LZ32DRAFT_238628 [Colletotrichum eremochloae]
MLARLPISIPLLLLLKCYAYTSNQAFFFFLYGTLTASPTRHLELSESEPLRPSKYPDRPPGLVRDSCRAAYCAPSTRPRMTIFRETPQKCLLQDMALEPGQELAAKGRCSREPGTL